MQTEVLRLIHPDYEVIVRTQDISYSWERFKGRINYSRRDNPDIDAPETYCRYTSKDECELRLYSPITRKKTEDEEETKLAVGKVWDKLWPVIFETCKYQVRLLFHGVDKDSVPEIRHVRKDIEDSFFVDEELNGREEKSLTGELDFLNEPGVFKLDFSYQKNGVRKDSYVTFDVVSPKLDTKNDYKSLLREINEEYENVIYRYLSITLQQFSRGRINTDATWMAAFQSVVDDYVKNVKRVIQNPHSQIVNFRTSRKAEQIKFWTPAMEERYSEVKKEGKLEEYYFGYNEAHSTHDTMENRFVKYTLQSIGKRLSSVITTVLSSSQEELSERHRQMWTDYQDSLRKLSKHPFFKTVGRFDDIKQDSLVLQNRLGYQQIYKDWLKLKRGIDLYNGAANIGTLQIWEIYELWCFIKMKKLVADVMGIDYNKPSHEQLVTEPKGTLLNPFTNSLFCTIMREMVVCDVTIVTFSGGARSHSSVRGTVLKLEDGFQVDYPQDGDHARLTVRGQSLEMTRSGQTQLRMSFEEGCGLPGGETVETGTGRSGKRDDPGRVYRTGRFRGTASADGIRESAGG